MRKLASIQRVLNVRPIEGADMIEVVDVLGWSVVVKKGEFKPDDFCVYFEVDSWLDNSNPAFATFEERFVNWGTKRGMRLKTIKLRKQLSQGLVLKTTDFPVLKQQDPIEGQDVTELLGIEKWEPAEESHSNGPNKTAGASQFPSFIRKTDQERVQNYINELGKHADETFEVTVKLDGSSMTVYHVSKDSEHYKHISEDVLKRKVRKMSVFQKLWYKAKIALRIEKLPDVFTGVCSRNIELGIDGDNHFSQYVREHGVLDKLEVYGRNLAIQGELIAPSIQQNHEQVKGFGFYVFDVFDIDNQRYLLPTAARGVATDLGLSYVPVLHQRLHMSYFYDREGAETKLIPRELVENILAYAEGPGMNPGVKREGLVFKSNSSEFSFKAISNSYLLKKDKQ